MLFSVTAAPTFPDDAGLGYLRSRTRLAPGRIQTDGEWPAVE
jgi:hypothetical protein